MQGPLKPAVPNRVIAGVARPVTANPQRSTAAAEAAGPQPVSVFAGIDQRRVDWLDKFIDGGGEDASDSIDILRESAISGNRFAKSALEARLIKIRPESTPAVVVSASERPVVMPAAPRKSAQNALRIERRDLERAERDPALFNSLRASLLKIDPWSIIRLRYRPAHSDSMGESVRWRRSKHYYEVVGALYVFFENQYALDLLIRRASFSLDAMCVLGRIAGWGSGRARAAIAGLNVEEHRSYLERNGSSARRAFAALMVAAQGGNERAREVLGNRWRELSAPVRNSNAMFADDKRTGVIPHFLQSNSAKYAEVLAITERIYGIIYGAKFSGQAKYVRGSVHNILASIEGQNVSEELARKYLLDLEAALNRNDKSHRAVTSRFRSAMKAKVVRDGFLAEVHEFIVKSARRFSKISRSNPYRDRLIRDFKELGKSLRADPKQSRFAVRISDCCDMIRAKLADAEEEEARLRIIRQTEEG